MRGDQYLVLRMMMNMARTMATAATRTTLVRLTETEKRAVAPVGPAAGGAVQTGAAAAAGAVTVGPASASAARVSDSARARMIRWTAVSEGRAEKWGAFMVVDH